MKGPLALAALTVIGLGAFVVLGTREEQEQLLSNRELAWIADYGKWSQRMTEAAFAGWEASRGERPLQNARNLFADLGRCRSSFDQTVGDAPSQRLEAVEGYLSDACSSAAEAGAAFAHTPNLPNPEAAPHLARALNSLEDASLELDEHLLIDRDLPQIGGRTGESRVEPTLTEVAAGVTGHPVEVRCWSAQDWATIERELTAVGGEKNESLLGNANVWQATAHLSPGVCRRLVDFAATRRLPRGRAAVAETVDAMLTLAHEAEHVSGQFHEPTVECYALQHVRYVSRALGAERKQADRLATLAWRLYRTGDISVGLRTPRCRDRSALDLNPESRRWP